MNLLNKTIAIFSPEYAYKREQYGQALALLGTNYDSINNDANYNSYLYEFDADDDIKDIEDLRATAREYYNNNGFYEAIIEAATDHVIGSGLIPKATIKKSQVKNISEQRIKEIEKQIDSYFYSWANSTISDITAKDNFFMLQRLAYSNFKIDGDSFSLLPLTQINNNKILQVQLVDAQDVKSPNSDFIAGIKVSKNRMPLKYSIRQSDGTYAEINAFTKGKRNVLHTFKRKRPKQVRGVPFLNSVTKDLAYIDSYMKTELNASKLSALFFGSITTDAKEPVFGEKDLLSKPGEQKQTVKNTIKENSITQLKSGETLNIHTVGRTVSNFDKFVMTHLEKITAKTRIPYEIVMAKFLSSYSASRAAMLQMMKFSKPERMLFIISFCKPIRDQVVTWGILNGDLYIPEFFENRSAILNCMWIGEPMGSVDPGKDIKANIEAINARLKTYEMATTELGFGDFESNIQILGEELEMVNNVNTITESNNDSN